MKKVLVVDDTKNIRVLLTKCLQLEGYEVLTASDGQEALEIFKNEEFDLAFLDIKMPQISGTEVLKQIRQAGITTPIIIITAYATIKNAVECTQMGAVAYLQKPFTADKVRSILHDLSVFQPCRNEPDTMESYIERVENLITQGKSAAAIEILKKAVSQEPANAEIMLLFSKAYEGMGDKEHAEKFYQSYQVFCK